MALQRYCCAMATIQIREIPEDAYEVIRKRARHVITENQRVLDFLEALPRNPHVLNLDNRQRGYLSISLNRSQMETRLQAISDREDRNASVSTAKRFVAPPSSWKTDYPFRSNLGLTPKDSSKSNKH